MNPIDFEQSNFTFTKPEDMSDCGDLKVYKGVTGFDGPFSISCWEASLRERIKFLFSGIVWLWVYGVSHPPVIVSVEDPFD